MLFVIEFAIYKHIEGVSYFSSCHKHRAHDLAVTYTLIAIVAKKELKSYV